MKNHFKVFTALALAVSLFCGTISVDAAASSITDNLQGNERVGKVATKQGTDYDTYLLEDGSFECVIYPCDRYYETEFGYEEIDNSVIPSQTEKNGILYTYANAAGANSFYFAEGRDLSVWMDTERGSLRLIPQGANAVNAAAGGLNEITADFSLSGKQMIAYPNVYQDTDLVYAVQNEGLKEYLVLYSQSSPDEFSYLLETEMKAELTDRNEVLLVNPDTQDCLTIGGLWAVDAEGKTTENIELAVKETADGVLITLKPDEAFRESAVYPLIIDPNVTVSGGNVTYDTFISGRYQSTNYYGQNYLSIGRSSDLYSTRSYIKFDIPGNIAPGAISSASIWLKKMSGAEPTAVVRRVTDAWTSSGLTWQNRPEGTLSGQSALVNEGDGWYSASLMGMINGWLDYSYENYGVIVQSTTESGTSQWTKFYSSDTASYLPELRITYSYQTMPVNRVSSLYSVLDTYNSSFVNKQNCYGYAMQLYCVDGAQGRAYHQYPGEFGDWLTYSNLEEIYNRYVYVGESAANWMSLVSTEMYADFQYLNQQYGDEWTLVREGVTASSTIPSGYRKIAVVTSESDFHFLLRHDDGTWSEKNGTLAPSNKSYSSHTLMTDENISVLGLEGGYDLIKFMLVKKSTVIDYPHQAAVNSAAHTQTLFTDRAGVNFRSAATVGRGVISGRFDYTGDEDMFVFSPSTSGNYKLAVSAGMGYCQPVLYVYNGYGNLLGSVSSSVEFSCSMSQGQKYFICIRDAANSTNTYTLNITT